MGQQALARVSAKPKSRGMAWEQIRPCEAVCCLHGERLPRVFQKQSFLQWVPLSLPSPGHVCCPALAPADTEAGATPKPEVLGAEGS